MVVGYRRSGEVTSLSRRAVGSIAWKRLKNYLIAECKYCGCQSPAVKFMARVKTPHHAADRQFIFSRTGDHDS